MDNFKNRHIKGFYEKYGKCSVMKDAMETYRVLRNSKTDDKEIYNQLPYIAYLYVPIYDDDFIYERDVEDLVIDGIDHVQIKVLEVDDHYVQIAHYDDHHNHCRIRSVFHQFHVIKGNQIILSKDLE